MTTYIPVQFSNNQTPPFQTVVTLDNTSYNFSAFWNLVGQRWYASITDQSGTIMWSGALIGSPMAYNIYLAPGIFTSTLLYREDSGNLEVT